MLCLDSRPDGPPSSGGWAGCQTRKTRVSRSSTAAVRGGKVPGKHRPASVENNRANDISYRWERDNDTRATLSQVMMDENEL